MNTYGFCLCHSLEKVFPDKMPEAVSEDFKLQAFKGEEVSVQLAYYEDCNDGDLLSESLEIKVCTEGGIQAEVKKVGLLPSAFPCNMEQDEDYLTTRPGLFPDSLIPVEDARVWGIYHQWRAVWIDLAPRLECEAGSYQVVLSVSLKDRGRLWSRSIQLEVLPLELPAQKLIHTEWFHGDCLADYYNVEVFSEEHWGIMEHFIRAAADHGMNMILTPVFTPPTDTMVGGERTTIQLVEVNREEGRWSYGFSRLERWLAMCLGCGMRYFEIAPLFTQWGAKAAPKIVGMEAGRQVRFFGWESQATGKEYTGFLQDFLPKLLAFLKEKGLEDKVWFHVSDEPGREDLENYKKAHECVRQCLPGCRLMDALSDFELYEQGIIQHPVVSNNHMEPFLQAEVPDLWTYYCCAQGAEVSNRFFAMPSYRNRIMGVQLYLNRIRGFLHWGYNFYNTQFSIEHINPYMVTDCGEAFPSGDAFLVYPGKDGKPVLSIRMMVFSEALHDLRALECLESLTSREYVEQLIRDQAGMDVTFKQYPRKASFLLKLREAVNEEIKNHVL